MHDRIRDFFDLTGKQALVTGGGRGIGREIARTLAEAGARVTIVDIDPGAGETAAHHLRESGHQADFREADISDAPSVQNLFSSLERDGTDLEILVNNAAVFPKYPTLDIQADQWDEVHSVTLRGTMLMCQAGVKMMRKAGRAGRIVNISSCSSLQTLVHGNAAYGAAKAGVNMLTKTYALEFAPDGITVNAVLPGGVETEGATQVKSSIQIAGPITGTGRVPLGRIGQPADIAAAVLYFASPAGSYATGQLLAVDGGFVIS